MAPHMRSTAQLSETASLSPSLSAASARRLRDRFEREQTDDQEEKKEGIGGTIVLAALLLLTTPVVTVQVTKHWPLETAARHLAAAAGCPVARAVGLAPAKAGQPGYWPWLDRERDGMTCEVEQP